MADSGRDEHGKASLWMEPANSAPRCAAAQRPNSIQVPNRAFMSTSDIPPPSGGGGGGGGGQRGAKARGRGGLFLQVVAIAAVSALLTVLGAGNMQVSVHFGDRANPRLSPPIIAAAVASRSLEPSASHADAGPMLSPSSLSAAPVPSTDSSRSPADAAGTDSKMGRRRETRRDKRSEGGTCA